VVSNLFCTFVVEDSDTDEHLHHQHHHLHHRLGFLKAFLTQLFWKNLWWFQIFFVPLLM
jgi:hypothetical protein